MKSIYRKLIHTHCIACLIGTWSCLQLHECPTSSFHLKDNSPSRSMYKFMLVLTPVKVSYCPGFGQDRVNFHQNPGRGTAGRADPTPTWPNRAGYSTPCAVVLGSGGQGGAARRERSRGSGWHSGGAVRESGCVLRVCFVYSPFSVSLLFLFPSVCCSVRLPLSRPTGFCLFLSILLRTLARGGAAAWRFCCRLQPNQNTYLQKSISCINFLMIFHLYE